MEPFTSGVGPSCYKFYFTDHTDLLTIYSNLLAQFKAQKYRKKQKVNPGLTNVYPFTL